ncbi:hypothetical protein FFLO_05707 [Filobasidium floriforme]|uniref:TPR-like protein n=1 Tax=Filobasidium floriforme TaxID=5210 RepID=A0A8K0NR57_9TREE|nr:uncharacterized protein HD553DRAFT_345742 [Filobasidium floriforme]KAG7529392.1 hypothetical protein FFLO_05707 [Filobasidium floriforme]KAH8079397.1 hypothetical protein HD553DRAFT_345742 [Filobasidium floriforme]
MGKTRSSKNKTGASSRASTSKAEQPTATDLIAQAHAYLGQSNFEQAINSLALALDIEPANREAKEILGIAEIEGGDVEKGREHLTGLLPPHVQDPAPSTYLYLAQTAPTPQEALQLYESAIKLLESKIEAFSTRGSGMEEEDADADVDVDVTKEELMKECITALVAMIEIWMSDLCFEPQASSECDTLIARALSIDPNDIDALLTLSSIRMSQSKADEAKQVILQVSRLVMDVIDRIDKAEDEGEAAVTSTNTETSDTTGQDRMADEADSNPVVRDLPSIPTRHLLTRLLLEHHQYVQALRVNDSVRREDELEVEGCYLEGWAWYCRGEAIEAGDEEGAKEKLPEEETLPSKNECWTEALSSFMECASLHESQEHPDQGILAHVQELIPLLEKAGIVVEVDDEEAGEDVDMA